MYFEDVVEIFHLSWLLSNERGEIHVIKGEFSRNSRIGIFWSLSLVSRWKSSVVIPESCIFRLVVEVVFLLFDDGSVCR